MGELKKITEVKTKVKSNGKMKRVDSKEENG